MGLVEQRLMAALERAPKPARPTGTRRDMQPRVHTGDSDLQTLNRDGAKHGTLLPHERGKPG